MYYIYFPFIFILSGLIFLQCKRRNLPIWWAAIVFAAPVTTPYFIVKSRKNNKLVFLLIFLACFSLVAAGEIFIYSKMNAKYNYVNLPPVTQQLMRYSEILKQTTHNLDNDFIEFEQHKVQSKIDKLGQLIVFIGKLRQDIDNNQAAIKQLIEFLDHHNDSFLKNDLKWVYEIKRYYNNRIVIQYFKSLENYLDNFEILLQFCYQNFDAITKVESVAHLKNYDAYYLRYRRAADSLSRFNIKRIEFQDDFIKRYPEIKKYLPAQRQTQTKAIRFLE
ncbi:hypothetical protein [Desulfobacter vibrioformis]|uniref:hypothetical protein n=1 Tax=Desulfobacter vibrioformis TaxID=34031 RepID=UPI000559742A|nr:hypothetical protein [Desulfobacter vibrioformis]